MSRTHHEVAVDPVTIVIKECITLSTAMRKYSKYTSQTGVAALLSGGSEIFSNQDDSLADTFNNLSTTKNKDPLLSGFVQLRLMLNNLSSLDYIDSLTLLQPFLLVISTPTISGYITSLALDSLQKFITFNIVSDLSSNHTIAYREAVNALTHCRFEGSEQTSDDSVLLKVLILLETVVKSKHSDILSDSIMYEVLQTVMSLACNKKRTEVLRKAAEMSMMSITVKIFAKLRQVEANDSQKYINDEDFSKNLLKDDTIGTAVDGSSVDDDAKDELSSTGNIEAPQRLGNKSQLYEENYGLPVIKDYLGILVSLIMPENQYKHNNSTKVFGLNLLNMAVEVSGNLFPHHPRLFNLISDPIFKNVLFIIQNTDKLSLLQSALHLFTTMVIIMGANLQRQVELTFRSIFDTLESDKSNNSRARSSATKELIIEQISILWTRSPSFFTVLFKNYDCNLNRSDLSAMVLNSLTKLALPESALITADSVPPICLEGLISLIDNMHNRIDGEDSFVSTQSSATQALEERAKKTEFIKCTDAFNTKPKKGITLLIENKFVNSDSEDHIAKFLFEKNGRLNKKAIGEYLASPDNASLLKKFVELFDFKGLRIDEAIRIMLTKFRLPGESQQIERVVETFSATYVESQEYDPKRAGLDIENDYSTVQPDADSVFILSFSVIMLNTDLHNPQVKKHMTFDDYTYNLKGCNDQKDFPMWYLDRIFCSIRDKEIVMPEEHHGTERWFDDAWNNLVSSTTVVTQTNQDSDDKVAILDKKSLLQFDKAIYEIVGPSVVQTLFKIFEVASDDHISTRMLTSIDKCSHIASFFGQHELFNVILERIARSTLLTKQSEHAANPQEPDEIPVVQINLEDSKEALTVSSLSVRFGKSFKSQLCNVVLFRLLQKNSAPDIINESVWCLIVEILLNLFENSMIVPDVFPDLQKTLKIGRLPRPAPEYSINKSRVNKGLLSTFASYLKGDEEPTDEELNFSISAMECIRSSRVTSSIFGNENNVMGKLVSLLMNYVPTTRTPENTRFFEAEILFIMELGLASYLFCKDNKDIGRAVLVKLVDITTLENVSKSFKRRVSAYKLLLVSVLEDPQAITKLINEDLLVENEVYNTEFLSSEQGSELLRMILSLTDIENYSSVLLRDNGFWKILRSFAAAKGHTFTVFEYLDNSILKKEYTISGANFLSILGLLDEISSIGSISGEWEEKYEKLKTRGQAAEVENPHQEAVDLSLKSINATSHLIELKRRDPFSKAELIGLLQALAHQCFNPCYQLRNYAVSSLDSMLLNHHDIFANVLSVSEVIENGLLIIMEGETKHTAIPEIMTLFSKVYTRYLDAGKADNETFLKILNVFNKYVENPVVEKTLQDLLEEKKKFEKLPILSNEDSEQTSDDVAKTSQNEK
ncbi:LANO_0G16314g1_1 [Lachancea nothofagi CBS 11611]|uniref:LANO_0G16314g1_1 n=1 Tax=Lachancea nothofagi CBS 11611 TaxID=1266666 RepID=A0A1G4KKC3_9SACH|nr:LANO_0G16314g1_1 [Lachancea nothofagi CBS 11611]